MGENISTKIDELSIMFEGHKLKNISQIFERLKREINSPIFKELKEELEDIESVVEKSLSEKDLKALEEIDKISTYEKFRDNLGKLSRALISQTMGK